MPVIHETAKYSFATRRGGGASLTRKADNTSVFFQPGDAANEAVAVADDVWHADVTALFDVWASEFADLFDAHAANRE